MSESSLWTWLKPYCPKGKYDRVESPDTSPGIPDVHYKLAGAEGWFELKEARGKSPAIPFPSTEHGLRKTQIPWISDYVALGGICHIVAQVGSEVFFVPGKFAHSFNGAELRRLRFFSVLVLDRGTPDPKSIPKLKALMLGELKR